MKLSKNIITLACICLLLAAVPATAQLAQQVKTDEERPDVITGQCSLIPDGGYDGSLGSMACMNVTGTPGTIADMTVQLGVNHTWVGDLVVKVQNPAGDTTTTVMSRPGGAEPDDGTTPFCCGNNDDMSDLSPVFYNDSNPTSAEDTGAGGIGVCSGDGLCTYFPFPDAGPGTNLADFAGQDADGTWLVCVGDGAGADSGELCSADIEFALEEPVPTMPWAGLLALVAVLATLSTIMLRRRASNLS